MRFKEFITEAVIHVDMALVNGKIKYLRGLVKEIKTLSKLVQVLNTLFGHEDIEFELVQNKEGKNGIVGGTMGYRGKQVVCVVYLDKNALNILKKDFPTFALELSHTLEHELVHVGQYEKVPVDIATRNNKDISDTSKNAYFANKQEIMAFANTIVREFQALRYEDSEILDIIKHVKEYGPEDHERFPKAFRTYLGRFQNEPKVLNRLYKYMYQYLTKEENNEI